MPVELIQVIDPVLEGEAFELTIAFTDLDDDAYAPGAVTYKIVDVKSGTVLHSGSITPSESMTLTVPATINRDVTGGDISNATDSYRRQQRRLTIFGDAATADVAKPKIVTWVVLLSPDYEQAAS